MSTIERQEVHGTRSLLPFFIAVIGIVGHLIVAIAVPYWQADRRAETLGVQITTYLDGTGLKPNELDLDAVGNAVFSLGPGPFQSRARDAEYVTYRASRDDFCVQDTFMGKTGTFGDCEGLEAVEVPLGDSQEKAAFPDTFIWEDDVLVHVKHRGVPDDSSGSREGESHEFTFLTAAPVKIIEVEVEFGLVCPVLIEEGQGSIVLPRDTSEEMRLVDYSSNVAAFSYYMDEYDNPSGEFKPSSCTRSPEESWQ